MVRPVIRLAEFESSLISERVKAGMERAKAEGKRTNRPPVDQKKIERMRELRTQGAFSARDREGARRLSGHCKQVHEGD